ncbi:dipeptide epimerase [Alphaproteobacteria bacterium GH1-50]|uniref:Dipeptide epimerase n=1 Tax=Kangsaoukella pontilimi TaxID=2691042 RepID=A0A7C9IR61_9RHOB|nr:N-acetyl-D-Glu racemase DgcA [Kangsaoukella pontilimi]MXQ08423.1 dipeptide epimerase [Kangsaoukella pontilimi]
MQITVTADRFPLAETFTISRGSRDAAEVLTVTVSDGQHTGQGECVPYARYGESMDSVTAQIEGLPDGIDRMALQNALPSGAARNAVDCAFWDYEAKTAGRPVWQLAGLAAPDPVTTAYTLSLDTPERMQAAAARHAHRPLLKIKLGGEGDMARLEAIRAGAPDTAIIVDANEGWTADVYSDLAPHLKRLGVLLVEQPLPAGQDDLLAEIERPVPVCADESCHDRASLPGLAGKYDMVNIKLDKTGGLTEALALRDAASAAGYRIMVGCMVGSSLAMAPALLVAQGAEVADLDGPLLLAKDRTPPMHHDENGLHPADPALWG